MSSSFRTSAVDGAEALLEQIVDTMEVAKPHATLRGGKVTREYLKQLILGKMFEDEQRGGEDHFREMYAQSLPRLMEYVLDGLKKYFKGQRLTF